MSLLTSKAQVSVSGTLVGRAGYRSSLWPQQTQAFTDVEVAIAGTAVQGQTPAGAAAGVQW